MGLLSDCIYGNLIFLYFYVIDGTPLIFTWDSTHKTIFSMTQWHNIIAIYIYLYADKTIQTVDRYISSIHRTSKISSRPEMLVSTWSKLKWGGVTYLDTSPVIYINYTIGQCII